MEHLILQILSRLVQFVISYLFLILFVTKFSQNTISKNNKILSFIILFFIEAISATLKYFSINIPFLSSILFLVCIFLISKFIFKLNINSSILLSLFMLIIKFLSYLIAFNIMIVFFKDNYLEISSSFKKYYTLVLISYFLQTLTLLFFNMKLKGKPKLKKLLLFDNNNSIPKINIIFLICFIPEYILITLSKYDVSASILTLFCVQTLFILIVSLEYLKTSLEKNKLNSDLEISNLHNKTMVSMVDGVRSLKHDYNNIMQALNGYIVTKQYDKLKEHIDKVLEECNIVNNLSIIDPKIFNDPAIYGVVGAKYYVAMQNDIKFELDIITDIKEINFSKPDLSRILGILLDNAIEATLKTDKKYIKLEMKYDLRKQADIIRVYNSYDTNEHIDLKDIYNKGVSSKEIKSGIGLWEVKKMINKSNNSQIYATIKNDLFIQNITIEK